MLHLVCVRRVILKTIFPLDPDLVRDDIENHVAEAAAVVFISPSGLMSQHVLEATPRYAQLAFALRRRSTPSQSTAPLR